MSRLSLLIALLPLFASVLRAVEVAGSEPAAAGPATAGQTYFTQLLPSGTTATCSVATEANGGPEALLDADPSTSLSPRQGTAQPGKPVSIFLRFPAPVAGLAGVVLGKSDKFGNYVWKRLEFWGDATGTGRYDLRLGSATGPGAGDKRFDAPATTPLHGLELRVIEQSISGTRRAFSLDGITGLIIADASGGGEMQYVVEDFEDLSSWRTWADNTAQPEGERSYGGFTYLCGVRRPGAPSGDAVGQLRYCFKEPPAGGLNTLRCKRGTVAGREALIERIAFQADPQGYPCRIWFELMDAKGKKAHTPGVELIGKGWQRYEIDVRSVAAGLTSPLRLEHLYLSSPQGGTGDVLLDEVTIIGSVDRTKRVTIGRVWDGMTYDPQKPLAPRYRLRNALDHAVTVDFKSALFSSFDPKHATALVSKQTPVSLPAAGEQLVTIDFGVVGYGHYEVDLSATAEGIAATTTDLLAVARLNGGRVNHQAMFIGSQHPADWIADPENTFVFKEVVGPLGLDCYRTGAPDKRVLDLGMLCAAGFGGMPRNLIRPEDKNDTRGEPTDYAAYQAWVEQEARSKYAPFTDRILGVEFYNEPDLPDFCYKPGIDVYLKMWRAWAAGMRAGAPGIKLGTGGNTVAHPKEKAAFNQRMYTELAQEADIAIWHAHGPLTNFVSRQRMVENWLTAGGRPLAKQRLGNTEAGNTSWNSSPERLAQADVLVKKIGWAKAQDNSAYYCWFTTTDTYDPQGGYAQGENWGLISADQRLKPSGQAMNELIRQLADATGAGEKSLDPRLQTCAFTRADGGQVLLSWPYQTGASFLQRIAVSGPVELCDLFGRRTTLTPTAGVVSYRVNGWPHYLRAARGITIAPAPVPEWVGMPTQIAAAEGTVVEINLNLARPQPTVATLDIALLNETGAIVATQTAALPATGRAQSRLTFPLPKGLAAGTRGYVIRLTGSGIEEVLPLQLIVGERVPRSPVPLLAGSNVVVPSATTAIRIDLASAIRDLVNDPSTPLWAGAADLSATLALAHDAQGLLITCSVQDQAHHPGEAGAKLWAGDSIQVGIATAGNQTEIGLTEAGGGYGWVYISPDPKLLGRLTLPLQVTRTGNITTYRSYLTFAMLGVTYIPGMELRAALLVNEDDGRGRVRVMSWFDGIHPSKDPSLYGWLILE